MGKKLSEIFLKKAIPQYAIINHIGSTAIGKV